MKKLVIAPHADDEVLGCSSILDDDTYVLYLGVNEFHVVDKEHRLREVEKVSILYGFNYSYLDNTVDEYCFKKILDLIQETINSVKPDEIYIPYPSYNQDHKTAYKASFTALRIHDKNHFVKKVFVYEQVHLNLWDEHFFKPNYFRYLNIELKKKGYMLHTSQIRGHRSFKMVDQLARLRGDQSMQEYAEGFKILRWVD